MIPYKARRFGRLVQALWAASRTRDPYFIADLRTGIATTREDLYRLRSPGGYKSVMRDLRGEG